jgi:hypothetical protein
VVSPKYDVISLQVCHSRDLSLNCMPGCCPMMLLLHSQLSAWEQRAACVVRSVCSKGVCCEQRPAAAEVLSAGLVGIDADAAALAVVAILQGLCLCRLPRQCWLHVQGMQRLCTKWAGCVCTHMSTMSDLGFEVTHRCVLAHCMATCSLYHTISVHGQRLGHACGAGMPEHSVLGW